MRKRDNINKNYILENIKSSNGLPISFSEKILDSIFDIILYGLKRDGIIKIKGFGTFKVLQKQARVGRNPKNGTVYEISKRKVVVFSPSNHVKKKINAKQ